MAEITGRLCINDVAAQPNQGTVLSGQIERDGRDGKALLNFALVVSWILCICPRTVDRESKQHDSCKERCKHSKVFHTFTSFIPGNFHPKLPGLVQYTSYIARTTGLSSDLPAGNGP
jgi:hypothetical protein